MNDLAYGPVDLLLIGFDGERPGPLVVGALRDLVDSETISLLDLVFITRDREGDVTIVEVGDLDDEHPLAEIPLDEEGIVADEDVEELAARLEPGTSAVILAIELLWARHFASALGKSGGVLLAEHRIPAAVITSVMAGTAP